MTQQQPCPHSTELPDTKAVVCLAGRRRHIVARAAAAKGQIRIDDAAGHWRPAHAAGLLAFQGLMQCSAAVHLRNRIVKTCPVFFQSLM